MDDESRQMHVDSLNIQVSNSQSLKDCLPVIKHAGSSGKGFPYAPEDFPSPGDVWTWRVGKRYTPAGFWQDRSVRPPDRLQSSTDNKMLFRGRASLEEYIRKTFPDADVDAFFASFVWKIPCTDVAKDASLKIIKSTECSKSAAIVQPAYCKASNETCRIKVKTGSALTPATCKICCSEPNFCRNCCCILCYKTVDWIYDCYSFIKCEALVDEKFICGHVAHIECALRAYMAGKVGGSIDLDAQYYCRCCDNKTDLLLHVEKIIKVSKSIDNRADIVKVLNLGFCVLRGSKKERAEELQNHIATSIEKLKHGVPSEDIWKKRSEIPELEQGKKRKCRRDELSWRLEEYKRSKMDSAATPVVMLQKKEGNEGAGESFLRRGEKKSHEPFQEQRAPQDEPVISSGCRPRHIPPEVQAHEIHDEQTEHSSDIAGLSPNPIEAHVDIDPNFPDYQQYNLDDDLLLFRNPLVRVLDEAKTLNFDTLTVRMVQLSDDTRNIVSYQHRLAKASEEVGSANVRLCLELHDLRKALREKEAALKEASASRDSELRRVREEARNAVVVECRAQITLVVDSVDEARKKNLERMQSLESRVEQSEASVAELRKDKDAWLLEKEAQREEIDRLRGELAQAKTDKELYMDKVVTLQTEVDKVDEFRDTINQMLNDTYLNFWRTKSLDWMEDYPQVMAEIHSHLLHEAKSVAARNGGASFNVETVNSQFTPDEIKVIAEGYKLLDAESSDDDSFDCENPVDPAHVTTGTSKEQVGPSTREAGRPSGKDAPVP